jgi:hypothetical protein
VPTNPSKRVNELNGTVGIRELPFQLTLDLYGCSELTANYAHAVKTGMVAQQLPDCSFKRCEPLFHGPSFAHQPINMVIIFYLVHGDSFLPGRMPAVLMGMSSRCGHNS